MGKVAIWVQFNDSRYPTLLPNKLNRIRDIRTDVVNRQEIYDSRIEEFRPAVTSRTEGTTVMGILCRNPTMFTVSLIKPRRNSKRNCSIYRVGEKFLR